MRVLGIDPGTVRMGYALLVEEGLVLEEHGVLSERRGLGLELRLHRLHQGLTAVMERLLPDEVAVEEPFVSGDKDRRTGIAVGQAQAVAFLVSAARGTPVYTYTPAQVKRSVTGYGAGSKEQVQEMVRLQLGLGQGPHPQDAADAAAVALCHLRIRQTQQLLASRGPS